MILAASSCATASLAPAYLAYDDGLMWPPSLPVAPEQAYRASIMATLIGPVLLFSLERCQAMLVPDMTDPTITMSASVGSSADW